MTPEEAVEAIISDMCGRSGGDHWFESVDEDIQDEIRETWVGIVRQVTSK